MKTKQFIITLLAGAGIMNVIMTSNVMAINVFTPCDPKAPGNASASSVCKASGDSASAMIGNVINVSLTVLGMISVLMIVIGGIRYTTSNGDSSALKGAKDTILYAVVGLVVAIMAYAIVHFVVGQF